MHRLEMYICLLWKLEMTMASSVTFLENIRATFRVYPLLNTSSNPTHLTTPAQRRQILDHESYSEIDCLGHIHEIYIFVFTPSFFIYAVGILPKSQCLPLLPSMALCISKCYWMSSLMMVGIKMNGEKAEDLREEKDQPLRLWNVTLKKWNVLQLEQCLHSAHVHCVLSRMSL